MAADLEFEITSIPSQIKKEVTCEEILSAGAKVKVEVGEHELDEVVPVGKIWEIVLNIRLVEKNV